MQRRKFIKETLTGLPILLLPASLLPSSCTESDDNGSPGEKAVIVVGAGISGLAAAKTLKEQGFNVIILEAQHRIGGRLRTDRTLGVEFDEGAGWIHGVNGNPITTLARQAGMNSVETPDDSRKSYDKGGRLRSAAVYDKAEEELYTILASMKTNGSINESFQTVFTTKYPDKANDRLWKFLLSTYVTFDTGDLNKLSSLLYDEGEEFSGAEKIALNGYDTIAEYLAKGLSVQLNQRVSAVNYSKNKVQVTHNGIISEADYVIVTVPLGVLKANTIQFTPNLPMAKQNAIQKVGMNCVNKFLLIWNTAFWDDVQYISYTPEISDRFTYFLNVKKFRPAVNALMTFAYAEYGRQTEVLSDAEIIHEIMLHLKDIYGNAIPNPVSMLRTKWYTNENAHGAYSYTAVGTEMQHFDDLAEEINDTLFFAGEHTEVDYFSTVHGAYLSGIREANKIIALQ
ncbi:monoamine oxidase [Spirosoma lacussanchae]|uniref:flavin monoamine oxidase family protein n=1 Tax=Spirosoma lacussanchae TaxID=1884249 RepID=UPI0011081A39|nr:FAD-dependent oxidoreductase [Spirosoma lacussanchae]